MLVNRVMRANVRRWVVVLVAAPMLMLGGPTRRAGSSGGPAECGACLPAMDAAPGCSLASADSAHKHPTNDATEHGGARVWHSEASGSRDHTVAVVDAHAGTERIRLTNHTSDVFAVLFSHDERRLFTGSRDPTVRVWTMDTGTCLHTLTGHGQSVTCLTLSPDDQRLAAGSWFGQIVLFDVATLDQIASFRAHDAAIRGVAFSSDGR